MSEAYPLKWPDGWPRTKKPKRSRFEVSMPCAIKRIRNEVRLMAGIYPLISSNIPLRKDGLPYSDRREPEDTGVAVYFQCGDKPLVIACDQWDRTRDNLCAIAKTIEALRGIERWGASEMMERAFSAFEALPAPKTWRETFGDASTINDLHSIYCQKAKKAHPDAGGSDAAMAELNAHYAQARRELEEA